MAYSPDGSQLAVSGYREVLLHHADGTGLVARLLGVSDRVQSIVFSPDGKLLAAVGGTPARFGEVQIWDAASHELKRSITVSSDTLFGASFSPDGSRLAVGCADNTIRVLAVDTGKELLKLAHHDNWVFGTAFSLDGKRLVSVGRDRAVKLTETATGAFLENLNLLKADSIQSPVILARIGFWWEVKTAFLTSIQWTVPELCGLARNRLIATVGAPGRIDHSSWPFNPTAVGWPWGAQPPKCAFMIPTRASGCRLWPDTKVVFTLWSSIPKGNWSRRVASMEHCGFSKPQPANR